MRTHINEFARYLERYYPTVFASLLGWTDISQ